MRDIMCSGYVAGSNTHFFGIDGSINKPANPSNVRSDMEARLSFQDDATANYKSMMAFCTPYGDGAKRDQVISISQRLLPWEVNPQGADKNGFPGGKSHFDAANEVFNLASIHFGEDVRAQENMEFISQVRAATPPLCCQRRGH